MIDQSIFWKRKRKHLKNKTIISSCDELSVCIFWCQYFKDQALRVKNENHTMQTWNSLSSMYINRFRFKMQRLRLNVLKMICGYRSWNHVYNETQWNYFMNEKIIMHSYFEWSNPYLPLLWPTNVNNAPSIFLSFSCEKRLFTFLPVPIVPKHCVHTVCVCQNLYWMKISEMPKFVS